MMDSYADLAHRDEYLDAKLRVAARFVWLGMIDITNPDDDLEPSDAWIISEAESLRALLMSRGSRPEGRYWDFRCYVLSLLGIARGYASSSRAVEQIAPPMPKPVPEPEPEDKPEPVAASNPVRDWIFGAKVD